MKPLADEFTTVVQSDSPTDTYCYSPGLVKLPTGRLIATMDFGGTGAARFENHCYRRNNANCNVCKVFVSDDNGETWCEKQSFPMLCARPFVAGTSLYLIGICKDMTIARSDDNGETWTSAIDLTHGEFWHSAPTNVWYKGDCVYLVMERMTHQKNGWPVGSIAPILMRGNIHSDLTKRENWTFASELVFDQEISPNALTDFGSPFYPDIPGGYMAGIPSGWLEANVVQLKKENDWFFDPTGHTFHIFLRCWTGLPWSGAFIKVVEHEDGSMETMFETAPSGQRIVFTSIPGGGQSKFHILYDEQTRLYWLLSNQFTDSMADFNRMTPNERNGYDRSRLVLHYSCNCFDWIFAGVVTAGKTLHQSRSYASMVIDGDDLLILSRTGDESALNGHDTNRITFHRVSNFRDLI